MRSGNRLPGFGNDTHGLGCLTLVDDGGEFSLKRLNVLEATMYFGGGPEIRLGNREAPGPLILVSWVCVQPWSHVRYLK